MISYALKWQYNFFLFISTPIIRSFFQILTYFLDFCKIVMMDENGKDIVSEEMADLIGDAANKVYTI